MKIIKFSSKDCGTCHLIAPMVRRECERANIELIDVDVDEQPALVEKYEINSLPTLIKVVDEEPADMKVGLISADQFRRWLEE